MTEDLANTVRLRLNFNFAAFIRNEANTELSLDASRLLLPYIKNQSYYRPTYTNKKSEKNKNFDRLL